MGVCSLYDTSFVLETAGITSQTPYTWSSRIEQKMKKLYTEIGNPVTAMIIRFIQAGKDPAGHGSSHKPSGRIIRRILPKMAEGKTGFVSITWLL